MAVKSTAVAMSTVGSLIVGSVSSALIRNDNASIRDPIFVSIQNQSTAAGVVLFGQASTVATGYLLPATTGGPAGAAGAPTFQISIVAKGEDIWATAVSGTPTIGVMGTRQNAP